MSFKAILLVLGLCCVVNSIYSKEVCRHSPDSVTKCCGTHYETKIIGGTNAEIAQYPWVVLIEYVNKDNAAKRLCQGVLISDRYVLTAGHCVAGTITDRIGKPTNIILGEHDTSHEGLDCVSVTPEDQECTEGAVRIQIEATIIHPEFTKATTPKNDIALIKLKEIAPYTDFIRPICLPTEDISQKTGDVTLTETGWGFIGNDQYNNTKKQVVRLPYVPNHACEAAFESIHVSVKLNKGQMCAGGQGRKAFCKASSGDPLTYQNDNVHELVGITSFGSNPCNLDIPTVYTNVYEYVPWIKSIITV